MEMEAGRLKELLDAGEAQLIDVRMPEEVESARIPGSRHVELAEIQAAAASIERERPVVFYCRSGDRSAMPADAFQAAGYDAYNLAGGILAWKEAGFAIEPEDGEIIQRGVA